MKYKVGDKVRINSLDWYNENKDENGSILCNYNYYFTRLMTKYCGEVMTIKDIINVPLCRCYMFEEDEFMCHFTDDMIEGLVEEEVDLIPKFGEYSDNEPLDIPTMTTEFVKKHGLPCPDGYEFRDENGNVIEAKKIVLEKKNIIREEQIDNAAQEYIDSDNAVLTYSDGFCEQTDHPFVRAAFKAGVEWADNNVTQDDCSKAPKLTSEDYSNGRFGYRLPAGFKAKLTERELILTPEKPEYPKNLLDCENVLNGIRNNRKKLLHKFNELLICRDAYWKIAGDWKPDYDSGVDKFGIFNFEGVIQKSCTSSSWERHINKILDFPTAEMRDAFYEAFKELIEECKELL